MPCPAGGPTRIDIPETVLVHKYYHTGDRTFQARFLPGGPCVVVGSHPRTAERLYIPVQMLPGAPRVKYTAHAIEYDYGSQGIVVRFPAHCGAAKVEYRHGTTLATRFDNAGGRVQVTVGNLSDRTGIGAACERVRAGAKNVTVTAIDRTSPLTRALLQPIRQVGQFIPGRNLLTSTPEEQATRLRDAQVREAQVRIEQDQGFIPQSR